MAQMPPEHRRAALMIAVTGVSFCIALAIIALLLR
jgi:hypothetical protein